MGNCSGKGKVYLQPNPQITYQRDPIYGFLRPYPMYVHNPDYEFPYNYEN